MTQPPLETVTETGYALQALLISRDEDLTRDLVSELGADTLAVCEDLDAAIRKLGYLDCAVGIFDIDDSVEDKDVLTLKNAQPNLAIIALSGKERVSQLLDSPVSDVVFRVMSKPPAAGQFRLALRSAFQEHEQLRIRIADGEDLSADAIARRSSVEASPAPYRRRLAIAAALVTVLFSALVLYIITRDGSDGPQLSSVSDTPGDTGEITLSQPTPIEEISDLLTYAQSAATSGQLIEPESASAIYYYRQVLERDPYDGDALAGLNAVTDQLIERALDAIEKGDTDSANKDLDVVESIRPTHSQLSAANTVLDQKLAELTTIQNQADAAERVRAAELEAERLEAEALETERTLLAEIDAALRAGNLVSMQSGSAVRLINDAWNSTDEPSEQLIGRAEQVASLLMTEARKALDEEHPQLAAALASQLANLPLENIPGRQTLDTDVAEAIRIANAVIEPARRTRMVPPEYPRNASRRGIEGWVHLSFNITSSGDVSDIRIVESTPDNTFDEAAAQAVSAWKYQPRTIDGEATEEPMEVRLQFQL